MAASTAADQSALEADRPEPEAIRLEFEAVRSEFEARRLEFQVQYAAATAFDASSPNNSADSSKSAGTRSGTRRDPRRRCGETTKIALTSAARDLVVAGLELFADASEDGAEATMSSGSRSCVWIDILADKINKLGLVGIPQMQGEASLSLMFVSDNKSGVLPVTVSGQLFGEDSDGEEVEELELFSVPIDVLDLLDMLTEKLGVPSRSPSGGATKAARS